MNYDSIIILAGIIFLIIVLYKELLHPVTAFLIIIAVFSVFKILTPQEVLSGFANEQIAVITLLLIIGSVVQKTAVMDTLFGYFFRRVKTYKGFMARMMLYVSSSSAFFNNTPLVAMMMPFVLSWSRDHNIAPSKLLIPLSFAAILGGSATLIGTSTNLLINGMAVENGYTTINIFDFSYVGVVMIILGLLYMLFFGHRLLPNRKTALTNFSEKTREYLVEAKVEAASPLIGKSIENAGLRSLKGLFLVELVRGTYRSSPVSPNRVIQADDLLIFAGETDYIVDLLKNQRGLSLNYSNDLVEREKAQIIEVVVSNNSTLINKKVKDANFRSRFDAAIIAVHRNGEKLRGKIGSIELRTGDVLLLIVGKGFYKRQENTNDFYFLSSVNEIHNISFKNRMLVMGGLLAAIVLAALKLIALFKGLIVLLVIIILFKLVSFSEIRKSINYELIAIAGLALALGKAMINTGTAEWLANGFIHLMQPFGIVGMLTGIFIITNMLASYMTNIAAVSIVFPISFSLAKSLLETGQITSIIPFILIVAYGASANFITPVGYLTNIMVYGSGNYTFKDFFKVGIPLVFIHLIVTVSILSVWALGF